MMKCVLFVLLAAMLTMVPGAVSARDSLGIYGSWGAFRDPAVPRCYAVAKARPSTLQRSNVPYVSIGTWPRRGVRGQVHFRLSRNIRKGSDLRLTIGGRRFAMVGAEGNGWAANRTMDAAIVAAMRSAERMTVRGRDNQGRPFSDRYELDGAATAMDAATVGCARRR
ncbi:MAG: invasion associated locus B family protein [Pontixanthobacter sp.]